MKILLTVTTATMVAICVVVARKKSKRRHLEEAEFWHDKKDKPFKRGEFL